MSLHQVRLLIFGIVILALVVSTLAYGLDYYRLDAGERLFHAKHIQLRPSGSIGVKLGMFGVALFFCLYAYPVRKRWKWLQRFGKTKHWLDFHILLGISVPTGDHASFVVQVSGHCGRRLLAHDRGDVERLCRTLHLCADTEESE
jgi:hypothetical protein